MVSPREVDSEVFRIPIDLEILYEKNGNMANVMLKITDGFSSI